MWPNDRFIKLSGIELPIIQAPMAGSALSDMVVAVSQAGGLGSLACALLSVENARKELETIRQRTSRPINANFFCYQPPREDQARDINWRRRLDAYYIQLQADSNSSIPNSARAPFDASLDFLLTAFRQNILTTTNANASVRTKVGFMPDRIRFAKNDTPRPGTSILIRRGWWFKSTQAHHQNHQ
jgi:nitronate monooxygenase